MHLHEHSLTPCVHVCSRFLAAARADDDWKCLVCDSKPLQGASEGGSPVKIAKGTGVESSGFSSSSSSASSSSSSTGSDGRNAIEID